MKRFTLIALIAVAAHAADPYQPTAEEQRQIQDKMAALSSHVKALAAKHIDADLLADVDVYRKAAEWILRYPEEFYAKAYVANTLAALNKGIERAKELESGPASWPKQKGRLVRAYISPVDGSVQPYGLIIPESYSGRPVRLDLVMHGKGATLNEVSFIAAHDGSQPVPAGQDFITLEVFGRTNNGYRWAGEADVFEALASVRRRYNIDPQRIVLRGFSMGGHSAWHIGLHYPGMWAATEAGAGFTETVKYAKLDNLPPYQQAVLHIYDAVDYSLNAFDAPFIGYGGEIDAQLQASTNIREQLTAEGFHFEQGPFRWTTNDLRALFLIGPNTPHRFHPDSKKMSDEYIEKALETAGQVPSHLRFVTYTTRYNHCYWITVEGLEKTYVRADVDATQAGKQFTVSTKNVSRLKLAGSGTFALDGQTIVSKAADTEFEKKNGKWRVSPGAASLQKTHGSQGPIDDAFMGPFLCVRPTGDAWNPAAQEYGRKTLDRFMADFAKWMRGDPRVKDDRDVSPSDIGAFNLVLFGDPGSNSLIAQVVGKLPIRWSKTEIGMAGQKFSAADHIPVLIYPNPLNPKRYVVINSGHTFGETEFRGTNALLFPRLGDYAVLGTDGAVALAGLFNENWRF
jgi:pimeloyl-ACP methyl ester carboxylesterase